jgi:hypothetical protein
MYDHSLDYYGCLKEAQVDCNFCKGLGYTVKLHPDYIKCVCGAGPFEDVAALAKHRKDEHP